MPTAKRLKYLEKQAKKKENQRTKEERLEKTNEIKKKLEEDAHLTPSVLPQIGDFYEIIDKFVEDGIAVQGSIPLPDIKSQLLYIFTNNKQKALDAMIKRDESKNKLKVNNDNNNRKITKKELLNKIKGNNVPKCNNELEKNDTTTTNTNL